MIAHLEKVGLPTRLDQIPGPKPTLDQLIDAIAQDKKVSRGALTFILTEGIGKSFVSKDVPVSQVRDYLQQKLNASA